MTSGYATTSVGRCSTAECEVTGIGAGPAPLTDWMTARRMDVVILSDEGPDR